MPANAGDDSTGLHEPTAAAQTEAITCPVICRTPHRVRCRYERHRHRQDDIPDVVYFPEGRRKPIASPGTKTFWRTTVCDPVPRIPIAFQLSPIRTPSARRETEKCSTCHSGDGSLYRPLVIRRSPASLCNGTRLHTQRECRSIQASRWPLCSPAQSLHLPRAAVVSRLGCHAGNSRRRRLPDAGASKTPMLWRSTAEPSSLSNGAYGCAEGYRRPILSALWRRTASHAATPPSSRLQSCRSHRVRQHGWRNLPPNRSIVSCHLLVMSICLSNPAIKTGCGIVTECLNSSSNAMYPVRAILPRNRSARHL